MAMGNKAAYMRSYRHQVPSTKHKRAWLQSGMFADYSAAVNALSVWMEERWLHYFPPSRDYIQTLDKADRPMRLLSSTPEHIKLIGGATIARRAYANSGCPACVQNRESGFRCPPDTDS